MRKTIIAAALAATLLGGGAALAGQDKPSPPMRDPLLHADADKDGVVTKAELLADVAARFAKVDTDHDGKITQAERDAVFEGMRGRMAKRMAERRGGGREGRGPGLRADANGDGIVTLDEQQAQALKMFGFVDRNGDQRVDQAEREALRDTLMAMRGPDGPRGPGHRRGPPPPPAGAPEAPGQ